MRKSPVELNFIKVKGHTGVDGNEEADRLHMAHPNGRVCGAKRPKCEAERSHHL